MTELLATDWFVWGVGLILAFQLLVILLGEAIYRAERRSAPIAGIFRALRNIVLPLAVMFVFLTRLLEIDREAVLVRLVETALWTGVVYTVLLAFNVVIFERAAQDSWRSRAPKLFQDLIRLLLVVIGAAIVLSVVWRQDLGGLVAALGVGSIVLGLALQETLGNLMSGIALFFERPFSVGDWIQVGGKSGQVVQVSWRSVHLRTVERNLLVLPNSVLGRETITNFSQPSNEQMLKLSFGFGLDAPPNRVKELLIDVAREIPEVAASPAPRAVTREVLNDRIRYEARLFVVHGGHIPVVTDRFTSAVWYAARRAGFALPLPKAIELQVHEGDAPAQHEQKGLEALLQKAEGFEMLPPESIAQLARDASATLFGAGERLIAAGDVPQSVYLITAGEAVGVVPAGAGEPGSIRFGPNDLVGVTSLARAQASDLDISAVTDVAVLRVPREVVARTLHENPQLSNRLARIWQLRADVLRRSSQQDRTPDAEVHVQREAEDNAA